MSSDYWNEQLQRFSKDYRVIAPDFRGHGRSANVSYGQRIARYAKDAREILDTLLNGEKAVVVGWSMGASVVMCMADLFPDAPVAGYVFIDQTPKILNDERWDAGVFGIKRADIDQQDKAIRGDYPAFLENFLPAMFSKPLSDEELRHYKNISLQIPPDIAADILIDHCSQDWRDVISNLDKKCLAIAGDLYVCCPGVIKMPELSPNVDLKVFAKQSHCMFIEAADDFETTLRNYLKSIGHVERTRML